MKKISVQKWSVLGLVLLAASAVTAAVVPSNKKQAVKSFDGKLTLSTLDPNQNTCRTALQAEQASCTNTASAIGSPNSGTTAFGNATISDTTTIPG